MSERASLLNKIQQLGFTLIDTGLYLNAYNCSDAFEYGVKIYEKYDMAVKEYTEKYGPLTAKDSFTLCNWYWTDMPCPWELEANC